MCFFFMDRNGSRYDESKLFGSGCDVHLNVSNFGYLIFYFQLIIVYLLFFNNFSKNTPKHLLTGDVFVLFFFLALLSYHGQSSNLSSAQSATAASFKAKSIV